MEPRQKDTELPTNQQFLGKYGWKLPQDEGMVVKSSGETTSAECKQFHISIFLKTLFCFLSVSFYNHFHNILRLFDVLPNFPFTKIETMRDYYL